MINSTHSIIIISSEESSNNDMELEQAKQQIQLDVREQYITQNSQDIINEFQWMSYHIEDCCETDYIRDFYHFYKNIDLKQLDLDEKKQQIKTSSICSDSSLFQVAEDIQRRMVLYGQIQNEQNIAQQSGALNQQNTHFENFYDQNDPFIDDEEFSQFKSNKHDEHLIQKDQMVVGKADYQQYNCFTGTPSDLYHTQTYQMRSLQFTEEQIDEQQKLKENQQSLQEIIHRQQLNKRQADNKIKDIDILTKQIKENEKARLIQSIVNIIKAKQKEALRINTEKN